MAPQNATQKPVEPSFEIDHRLQPPLHVIGIRRNRQMTEGGSMSGEATRHAYANVDILSAPLRRQVIDELRIASQRGPT